ncbi:MAG TPA: L,D-transpeptidase family protein [Frankiaceae bacterium]|nr:L,D-transpeptidase family protein [Frankiaceae bacterium]
MSVRPAPFTALLAAAVALGLGLTACGPGSSSDYVAAPGPTSAAAPSPASSPVAPSTAPTSSPSAAPTSAAPSPTHVGLALGDKGAAVLALQKRLVQLGFWLSGADGSYGDTTQQAVLAFQKAKGLERDGVAGPQTMKAIETGVAIAPRSTSGHVLEVDKTRQLLLIVNNGKVADILNTSTGSGQAYQQGGQTYTALTPSGQFTIFRQVDADDPGPLGDLWRPKYFNGGIAIHGAPVVPGYPASHGCARLSNAAIDWIWSANLAPIGTNVWVY